MWRRCDCDANYRAVVIPRVTHSCEQQRCDFLSGVLPYRCRRVRSVRAAKRIDHHGMTLMGTARAPDVGTSPSRRGQRARRDADVSSRTLSWRALLVPRTKSVRRMILRVLCGWPLFPIAYAERSGARCWGRRWRPAPQERTQNDPAGLAWLGPIPKSVRRTILRVWDVPACGIQPARTFCVRTWGSGSRLRTQLGTGRGVRSTSRAHWIPPPRSCHPRTTARRRGRRRGRGRGEGDGEGAGGATARAGRGRRRGRREGQGWPGWGDDRGGRAPSATLSDLSASAWS